MASKNSVLLTIKQKPGIKYNDLLTKIVGEYSNINSARAALSRLVKDLEAFGLVRRKHNSLYLTDKGVLKIQTEMKNKLLLKINEAVKKPDIANPGFLVQQISVLVERSKKDSDLRTVAKSAISFPVSRLDSVSKEIQEQSRHLAYLSRILNNHSRAMRQMEFMDSFTLKKGNNRMVKTISRIEKILKSDFIVKTETEKLRELEEEFNGVKKGESSIFPVSSFSKASKKLFDESETGEIIAGNTRIELANKKISFYGPASKIKEIKR